MSETAAAGAAGPGTVGIGATGWRATLVVAKRRVKEDRVTVSAGSLAYHGFLAFFPAVIAGLGLLTLVHVGGGTLHHLTHGVAKALPQGAAGVFEAAVRAATRRSAGSLAAVVVGVLVALWSASSAMAVLQQTLDVAYRVPSDRTFVARRVRGVGLMALTGVFGGVAAALIVFGKPIGSAVDGVVPVGGTAFEDGWTALRWVLAFALVSLLFTLYYQVAPNRRAPRWQWLTPGSLVASAVFLLASLGFSYYISTFGSYGKTYGSFAGVAIFIFWLYLTALAVLLGGELNAARECPAAPAPPAAAVRGPDGRGPDDAATGRGRRRVEERAARSS
jgi:membrane protein